MKFRLLSILVIMFMVSNFAFASTVWDPCFGEIYWSEATGWDFDYVPNDTTQVKVSIEGEAVILNSVEGFNAQKVTIGGYYPSGYANSPLLTIVDGGALYSNKETQVGDSSGKGGRVVQTGGLFSASAASSGKVYVGYKSSGGGFGDYTISGGTITGDATWRIGYSATGADGLMTIVGADASITMGDLLVAQETAVTPVICIGELAFEVVDGAVTYINVVAGTYGTGTVSIDPDVDADATANLIVSLTSGTQADVILLVKNDGTDIVNGVFDNITLSGGLVGTITYTYNAETSELTGGNDIALLIPEPATIALLSLGMFIIRRKK